jgi:hypothetical protein
MESTPAGDAGIELAPGETLVPGSVTTEPAAAAEGEPVESASDAEGEEAPPEPKADTDTDV